MQINNRKELKAILNYEKKIYIPSNVKERIILIFTNDERYLFYKYLRYLRLEEYYLCKDKIFRPMFYIYARKKNLLGNKIGVKIIPLHVGKGINIHHKNIIINGFVGNDCVFHGNNCIGNVTQNIQEPEKIPTIMNNVNFGYGSIVIGNTFVADNVRIGAGAVIIKSISEPGTTAVGVPGHIVLKELN